MSRFLTVTFAVLLILMMVLAGCGGSDDSTDDQRTPAADDDDFVPPDDDDSGDDDDDDDDDITEGLVEIVSPQEGETILGYQVPVEILFADEGKAYLVPESYQLVLDDLNVTSYLAYSPSDGRAWGDIPGVDEGEHELTFTAQFSDNRTGEDSVSFFTTLEGQPRIELTLSENTIPAGGNTVATWVVYDDQNTDVTDQANVILSASPDTGVTIEGNTLTFATDGTYTVTAATEWDDQAISDEDTVVVFPAGQISRVEVSCSPNEIPAGDDVECDATVYDGNDNPMEHPVYYTTNPSQGSTVNGNTITLTYAGNITIIGTAAGTNVSGNDSVLVNAGAPFTVNLTLDPDEISVEETLTAQAAVVDEFQNPVAGGVELESSPTTGIDIVGMDITPHVAGSFTITARSVDNPSMFDSAGLTVIEALPPVVTITSPERGLFTQNASLNITGTAIDQHSEVVVVRVNGTPCYYNQATGEFHYTASLNLGLNIFIIEAVDSYDNVGTATISAMYTGIYLPNGDEVSNAIAARINDPGLNSIELIAEEMIEEYRPTLMSMIPDPLFSETLEVWGFEIASASARLTSLDFDPVDVELTSQYGGIHLTASVANVVGLGTLTYSIFDKDTGTTKDTVNYTLTITNMTIQMDLGITVTTEGTLAVTISNPEIGITGFDLDISGGGIMGDILDWLIGLFDDTIIDILGGTIEDMIISEIAPMIQDLLNDLTLSFAFDILNFTYVFDANFSDLTEFGPDGGSIWINAMANYGNGSWAVGPNTPDLPGSLLTASPVPDLGPYIPGTTTPYGFGAVFSDDLLNQVLHATHRSGLLSLDLDQETLELLGISGFTLTTTWLGLLMPGLIPEYGLNKTVEIRLRPLLPPVMLFNTEKGLPAELQFGDFILEWWCERSADEWELFAKVDLAMFIPVDIDVSDKQSISITFGEIEMYSELYEEPVFDIGNGFIENVLPALVELLIPALLGSLLEEIPIPTFEGYTLEVESLQTVGTAQDWAGMFGSLVATTKSRFSAAKKIAE